LQTSFFCFWNSYVSPLCVYVNIHVCIYILYIYIYARLTAVCIYTQIHMYIYTYTHIQIYACGASPYVYTHKQIYVYINTYIHTNIKIKRLSALNPRRSVGSSILMNPNIIKTISSLPLWPHTLTCFFDLLPEPPPSPLFLPAPTNKCVYTFLRMYIYSLMSHVAYAPVLPHSNESCRIIYKFSFMSHVTCECIMPRMNESCHIYRFVPRAPPYPLHS